jgi:prolyl oligopeptidase
MPHFCPRYLPSVLTLLFAALASAAALAIEPPPQAPVRPVTDDYFGTQVTDNYRYMERLSDPEVQAWMKAQADYTQRLLEQLPGRMSLLNRIHTLYSTDMHIGQLTRRGQRYFYEQTDPDALLPKLYYRDGLAGAAHLLFDPAAQGQAGHAHAALDFYQPSWDGRYVVLGVSTGGSEHSVLHVLEVAAAQMLPEAIDRTDDSVIAWRPDNRSFFYLRYAKPTPQTPPAELLYNGRSYLHVLGSHPDGDGDAVVFGRGVSPAVDVPEGQGTYIVLSPDSSYAVAVANHNMDQNPSTVYVAPLSQVSGSATRWQKVADVEDGVCDFKLRGDQLYLLTQGGAPHFKIVALSLHHPDLRSARTVVPAGSAVIVSFALAKDGLYARERLGVHTQMLRASLDGSGSEVLALPEATNALDPVTDPAEAGVLFSVQGWVHPPSILSYQPGDTAPRDSALLPPSRLDVSPFVAEEVFAVSYDGTRIPLSILHRRDLKLDGSHPTVLRGYGAYGLVYEPVFDPTAIAWLERGGILAIAHIRGGGEYGEEWHHGGFMRTKLNTVFDFIACAQYLVDAHYTAPRYLAANGASAGGITIGGALTWRPQLFGVILDQVGMSDTLRFELEPNGPPNVVEFGSVTTEPGFHALYAMSAYAHVHDGTAYPAVMFLTGANDPRVSPSQMLKMAARVQAATSSRRPVLLRVDYDAGHGIGSTTSQREVTLADMLSFALWQMGDPQFQPAEQ